MRQAKCSPTASRPSSHSLPHAVQQYSTAWTLLNVA